MASSAVSNALAKLDLMLENGRRLYNVSNQFQLIHSELTVLQGFLRDVDSRGRRNQDVRVRQWMNQVRDVAFRIEDAVDTFPIDIDENHTSSFSCRCRNLEMVVTNPIRRNELHRELREIRETLQTISQSGIDFGITNASSLSENDRQHLRAINLSEIDDSEIVGLHCEKSQIMKCLLNRRNSRLTVLSIVGAGGLGKTILAQRVFKSVEVVQNFDCLIWLPISHDLNENNLLRKLLHSIRPNARHDESATNQTIEAQVRTSLSNKRYFIVLDDMRTPDLLQRLMRTALPENNNASRVLITCRDMNDMNVANMADIVPHNLRALNADESLALLFKKAFHKIELSQYITQSDGYSINGLVQQVNHLFGWFWHLPCRILDRQVYNHTYSDQNYPANLVEVAKQLAERCGGLPLELILLGGILSTKEPHFVTWKKVNETLDWHDALPAQQRSRILNISIEDLPSHLKSCFLYFALFPEDYEISAKQVTRMWIAEGLVPRDGAGMGTMENKAEELLEELVQRCLVQVTEKTWNGYAKSCRMHDSVRAIAICEANADNFFTILSSAEDLNQQVPAGSVVRRASLQSHTPTDFEAHSKNTRSLFCFWECISRFQGFRVLRVLLIEHVRMSGKEASYKSWLEGLVHLKYLGFRYCEEMPRGFEKISFGAMKKLETLDCKKTKIRPFDNNHSLWKIPTLRHVIITSPSGMHCPSKWNHLKNLQTLKWVSLENIPSLQYDLSLCTLKIQNPRQHGSVEEAWRRLEALLLRTPQLVSLAVRITKGHLPFLTVGTRNVPCHKKIQSLWLRGEWSTGANLCVLCVKMFPTNLTKLRLECACFRKDPMPILERLQSLRILQLWRDSYQGMQLTCSTGGFPGLQKLELVKLYHLRQLEVQERAMPALKQLAIGNCPQFHALPDLQMIPTLQRLLLTCASPVLQQRLRDEDSHKIKHISSVHVTVDTDTDA